MLGRARWSPYLRRCVSLTASRIQHRCAFKPLVSFSHLSISFSDIWHRNQTNSEPNQLAIDQAWSQYILQHKPSQKDIEHILDICISSRNCTQLSKYLKIGSEILPEGQRVQTKYFESAIELYLSNKEVYQCLDLLRVICTSDVRISSTTLDRMFGLFSRASDPFLFVSLIHLFTSSNRYDLIPSSACRAIQQCWEGFVNASNLINPRLMSIPSDNSPGGNSETLSRLQNSILFGLCSSSWKETHKLLELFAQYHSPLFPAFLSILMIGASKHAPLSTFDSLSTYIYDLGHYQNSALFFVILPALIDANRFATILKIIGSTQETSEVFLKTRTSAQLQDLLASIVAAKPSFSQAQFAFLVLRHLLRMGAEIDDGMLVNLFYNCASEQNPAMAVTLMQLLESRVNSPSQAAHIIEKVDGDTFAHMAILCARAGNMILVRIAFHFFQKKMPRRMDDALVRELLKSLANFHSASQATEYLTQLRGLVYIRNPTFHWGLDKLVYRAIEQRDFRTAWVLAGQLESESIRMKPDILEGLLVLGIQAKLVRPAFEILRRYELLGEKPPASACSELFYLCFATGRLERALNVAQSMLKWGYPIDLISFTEILTLHRQQPRLMQLLQTLQSVAANDLALNMQLLHGHLMSGDTEAAITLLKQLKSEGVPLNDEVWMVALSTSFLKADFDATKQIERLMKQNGVFLDLRTIKQQSNDLPRAHLFAARCGTLKNERYGRVRPSTSYLPPTTVEIDQHYTQVVSETILALVLQCEGETARSILETRERAGFVPPLSFLAETMFLCATNAPLGANSWNSKLHAQCSQLVEQYYSHEQLQPYLDALFGFQSGVFSPSESDQILARDLLSLNKYSAKRNNHAVSNAVLKQFPIQPAS